MFGLLVPLVMAELVLGLLVPRLPISAGLARQVGLGDHLPLTFDHNALERLASGQAVWRFDANLGWAPTPGIERPHQNKVGETVLYQHNRSGIRADQDYTASPLPGTRRYSAYGDSFTYCEEANLSDCWTSKLSEYLPATEVLNFGVPGHAPDQAWLRYQQGGADWQPCAVLIGHMVENINRVINRFRPFYTGDTPGDIPGPKPRYVLQDDRLVLLPNPARSADDLLDPRWVETNLGPQDAWYFPGTFVANPLDRLHVVRVARSAAYRYSRRNWPWWWSRYHPDHEALKVLTAVLVEFAAQVRRDGATPVVLVFPLTWEILDQRDGAPKRHAALLEALERHGVPFVDLTDALGEQARFSERQELIEGHYRPLGNAVVARALSERLPALTSPTCGSS